jgi:hypothetical protein
MIFQLLNSNYHNKIPVSPIMMNLNIYENDILLFFANEFEKLCDLFFW